MYPDPKRIRSNRLTIRLDDYETDLVKSLANYKGEQLSTLLREMVMKELREMSNLGISVERHAA